MVGEDHTNHYHDHSGWWWSSSSSSSWCKTCNRGRDITLLVGLLLYIVFTSYYNENSNLILPSSSTDLHHSSNTNVVTDSNLRVNCNATITTPSSTKKIGENEDSNDDDDYMIQNGKNSSIIEKVEVVYNDLKYRRACTNDGIGSILCMTIRYPFEVPLQQTADPTIRYPTPVQTKFYTLSKRNVYVFKEQDWIDCSNKITNGTASSASADDDMLLVDDSIVDVCMTNQATEQSKNPNGPAGDYVVVLWTRYQIQYNRTIFHGIGHTSAVHRVYEFFGPDHEVIVTGASPSPLVTEHIRMLFSGICRSSGVHNRVNYNCDESEQRTTTTTTTNQGNNNNNNTMVGVANSSDGSLSKKNNRNRQRRYLAEPNNVTPVYKNFTQLEEGHINVANVDYRLLIGNNGQHILDPTSTFESITEKVRRPVGYQGLRNMSLIVECPFAHIQSQDMILSNPSQMYSTIRAFQYVLPTYYMEFQSQRGRKRLSKLNGYQFQHLIVFDGLPQFYPTVTNGWTYHLYGIDQAWDKSPEKFTYNGWKPEYGRSCVGPLPSNSILREINTMSRTSFMKLGHNMQRWYGRTWEFANLFWYQMKMYTGPKGLDCTHSGEWADGISGVHKYFVQAMIDDYFENP